MCIRDRALPYLVHAYLPAENERPAAFVDDRFTLDVVLIADLADDFLEQVLDGDKPGCAAVLVHHDRHLQLAALHLLEQLRYSLALGHEMRRAHQGCQRRRGFRRKRDQVLHVDDAKDVVETVSKDWHAGVLLLAKQRAEISKRRINLNGDNVWTRRHYFTRNGLRKVDDRLQQLPPFLLRDRIVGCGLRLGSRRLGLRFTVAPAIALALAVRTEHANHGERHRLQQARNGVEDGQQQVERLLRVASHDQHLSL